MTKTAFSFPVIDKVTPLSAHPFYQWLDVNYTKQTEPSTYDAAFAYLASLGFVVGQDRISEAAYTVLEYVFASWSQNTPWLPGQHDLDAVLLPGGEFFVAGAQGRREVSGGIQTALKSCWIFEAAPDNTFFVVIGDRLFAKYQQILGSKFICRLGAA